MKLLTHISSLSFFVSSFTLSSAFTTFHPKTTNINMYMSSSSPESSETSSTASDLTSRRSILQTSLTTLTASSILVSSLSSFPQQSSARLDPVNNPSLLPSTPNEVVIQTEKFLTSGQVKRMSDLLVALEKDTGFRLRLLCQSYPNTPGLAIRDYWDLGKDGQKDDKYVVLVVDQFGGKGNVLNFNVGDGVKFALPNVFWTRLSSKYGNTFFVKENGIDIAITNAIEAIVQCLRSEDAYCVNVPDTGVSMKSLGL
mmetsp:Transcript_1717/g.2265  ORF Transcript_1717/g.2265 Transcript_1717/m.2265 type:complete len:255 (-) Transcript_1717:149-913(-)